MKKTIAKIISVAIALICVAGFTVMITSGAESEPVLNIEGFNLSFSDSVYIEYAVSYENASDVKLLVWTNPAAEFVKGTETAVLSPAYSVTVNGKECKVFDYKDLAAKQMTDNVYARAYVEKGGVGYYSNVTKYSVLQYVYNKLGKTGTATTNEDLKALLTDMLEYGASAQKYFGYKTDRLATSDFVQVKVVGGVLDDGSTSGLYLEGDKVTFTAPATGSEGAVFSHWSNGAGEIVAKTESFELTVTAQNETYTAVYDKKYSEGLKFISNGDGTCYVAGIGSCTDTDVVIPQESPEGEIVTGIGEYAFDGCTGLTSIELPNSVTSIGPYAFQGCTNMSITLPDSVTYIGWYAFSGCNGLTNVKISSGMTSIGNSAFANCKGLESIEIPNSVTKIGNYTFANCVNLTNITLPDSVNSIGSQAFQNCLRFTSVEIPNSVTSIGVRAFSGCKGLTSIEIPNSVTSIGDYAFNGCTDLTSISIGNGVNFIGYSAFNNTAYYNNAENWLDGVLYIGDYLIDAQPDMLPADYTINAGTKCIAGYAFAGCTGLSSITIPNNSVKYIGYWAFRGCTSLTSITIPDSVKSIGVSTFSHCTSLMNIEVDAGNTAYYVVDNCLIERSKKTIIAGCQNSVIPADGSVTSIKRYAFYGCTGLTSITIPSSVTSIEYAAFSGCSGLTNITVDDGNTVYHLSGNCIIETSTNTLVAGFQNSIIPTDGSVTSIGTFAFYGFTNLTSISIPGSVTSIGSYAFRHCTRLTSIDFEGTKAQWYAISKGSDWNYNTGSYKIYCTDGTISK